MLSICSPFWVSMTTANIRKRKSVCNPCTSQGPLSAITQNNRDSTVLADCAKHCSSLTQEEAEWLSQIKTRSLYRLSLFFPVVSCRCGQETRRMAGLCLADLRPIAGFAGASDERGGGDVREM